MWKVNQKIAMQQLKLKILKCLGGSCHDLKTQHHEMSSLNFSSLGDLHPRPKWVKNMGHGVSRGKLYIPDEFEENLHCFRNNKPQQPWAFTKPTSKLLPTEKPCGFPPMDTSWRRQLQSFKLQWRLKPQTLHSKPERAGTTGKSSNQKKGWNVHGDCSPYETTWFTTGLGCRYILFAACSW